ncbi:MAG: UDP-N-acetylmuramoyl-tripeptide--D-alanyl-D-alanine ligase, partial [Candidatus Dadabacteria bacterium]|nr:UDP-N-acetylmuramoyl-tripeptide--D-alanyl-D-alanine ligase [Candidatus Dadabacteria bacterium]NIS09873.1 UDP-N-acetylmuramoyl-tripeptide--D-alanyl-D-alanine ligase [Candidatus Dadabacteria bacterium]NIV41641.1 UDP-N-acetylmuramoyl-tripeptide--D-alanyl-D-alanine ligase [Candidatus Dadabacteria bacterium]NIX16300.1 UDP-N-acetylmuramoyl-tripeptide--D-alanyl-D-alanine ligase [Candidatus Dadabacteria bacterium]NIY22903.1 UDP-N-acetylmuramoyl-tripeptide--D-alanyl-D-alanine ligase [Candidatus Dadab
MIDTNFILNSTKGQLVSENIDFKFSGISTDSRTIEKDQLFVALKGENFDGHKFICDAITRGAAGVILEDLCEKPKPGKKLYVKVDSTLKSLGSLAKNWRESFSDLKVVAITGSNGKTTTKEMVSALAAKKYNVLKNTGNFNNLIGLPLTLFNLTEENEVAVLELGMNQFGEISRLAEICSPDIGIITNIGKAHIGNLGGIEGVKKAKGELVENFGPDQIFIVNNDDPRVVEIASKVNCKKITYSLKSNADIRAFNIERDGLCSTRFTLRIADKDKTVRLNNIGIHNVANALCASACGTALGLTLDEIASALQNFEFPKMRLEIIDSEHGFKIINDCYNANPDSMKNAITELCEYKGD